MSSTIFFSGFGGCLFSKAGPQVVQTKEISHRLSSPVLTSPLSQLTALSDVHQAPNIIFEGISYRNLHLRGTSG